MDVFQDARNTTQRFEQYIGDLTRLFLFHGLPCGDAEAFSLLAKKLEESRALRTDLPALLRGIRDMEQGAMSADDMLTVLALASGGPDFVDGLSVAPGTAHTVSMLRMLVAGVGSWSEAGFQTQPAAKRPKAVREETVLRKPTEEEKITTAIEDLRAQLETVQRRVEQFSPEPVESKPSRGQYPQEAGRQADEATWSRAEATATAACYEEDPPRRLQQMIAEAVDLSLELPAAERGRDSQTEVEGDEGAETGSDSAWLESSRPLVPEPLWPTPDDAPAGRDGEGSGAHHEMSPDPVAALPAGPKSERGGAEAQMEEEPYRIEALGSQPLLYGTDFGSAPNRGFPGRGVLAQSKLMRAAAGVAACVLFLVLWLAFRANGRTASADGRLPSVPAASATHSVAPSTASAQVGSPEIKPSVMSVGTGSHEGAGHAEVLPGDRRLVTVESRKGLNRTAAPVDRPPQEKVERASASGKPVVLTASVLDRRLLTSRKPVYPPEALTRGLGGKVVVNAFIGTDGSVTRMDLVRGDSMFVKSAMAAISWRRYKPYLEHGRPVPVESQIIVSYPAPS